VFLIIAVIRQESAIHDVAVHFFTSPQQRRGVANVGWFDVLPVQVSIGHFGSR